MFDFHFFSPKNIKKTQETLNLKNKKEFSENTYLVFFVFSKTDLKNSFQKHEPNMSLVFSEKCFCYLNLVHFLCFLFYRTKKKNKLGSKHVLLVFLVLFVFKNIKQFSKTGLVPVWFIFLKTILLSKKQGEQIKQEECVWFSFFLFFCSKKKLKTYLVKRDLIFFMFGVFPKPQFSENIFLVSINQSLTFSNMPPNPALLCS